MSCDEPILHFGLGEEDYIGVLEIHWADGTVQDFGDIYANRYLEISQIKEETTIPFPITPKRKIFREVPTLEDIRHRETPFDDYKLQPLLPHKLSRLGPGKAWADLDGNGLPDLYLGGAAGQAGSIWLNHGNGEFRKLVTPAFGADKDSEDMGSLFFDYDGDGRLDLLVASGGIESEQGSPSYRDRLYRNVGGARFESTPFPGGESSSGPVAASDFDRDGDLDLFIGGRLRPGQYPLSGKNRLLRNDDGKFTDATKLLSPGLVEAGMVTGALWTDATGNGWSDLLISTEWGSIKLFENNGGRLVEVMKKAGLDNLTGWWTGIASADFDSDGDLDYAIGNLGLNNKYKVSRNHPYEAYYGDFDDTGRQCFVEATWEHGKLFPVRGRSCSTEVMPFVGRKYASYDAFARATMPEIYSPQRLANSYRVEAKTLESGILLNDGKGSFTFRPFPFIAQISPTFGIVAEDFDADGNIDLVLAQNFFSPQPETGRMAGGLSQFLQGNGDGTFTPLPPEKSGIAVKGDCRRLAALDLNGDGNLDLAFGRNDDSPNFLLRSEDEPAISGKGRLSIRLQGAKGNFQGIGSRLTLHFPNGSIQTAEIQAGSSYLTQTPAVHYFGLGKKSATSIQVRWPNGKATTTQIAKGTEDLTLSHP